jgi:hypothetical protein
LALPQPLVFSAVVESFNGKSKLQGCISASFAHFHVYDVTVNPVLGLFAGQTSLAFHY